MTGVRVVGIDPGPIPGIVRLHIEKGRIIERWTHVIQCTSTVAPEILGALLANGKDAWPVTHVQIETFVVGRGSMKSGRHGAVTRDQVGLLRQVWEDYDSTSTGRLGGHWFQRSAAQVKPWATDHRLEAAGLLDATKGMRHARDGARHALFCAVHDAGVPDPLSRKATR